MRDLLPHEMARYRHVEETFARVCRQWGYSEIRTPTIEFLHLFTAAGTLSPQMLERTYSFLDWDGWSGERVVLRPDATIPAVRLYVENLPIGDRARLFYTQNVFRFSLGDESREDWQCGVELIGDPAKTGDIELILLGVGVLQALGLKDTSVGLSHAGLVRSVLDAAGLGSEEKVASYDRLLDGDLTVLPDIEARLPDLNAPLHLLFDTEGGKSSYLANLKAAFSTVMPAIAGPLDELSDITRVLERLNCAYCVQTTLVRNFEYYTGPVFEFRVGAGSAGRGGRYDDLIELVGGKKVRASGFALTVANLVSQLGAEPTATPEGDCWSIRPAGDDVQSLADAFATAAHLRVRGQRVSVVAAGVGPDAALEVTPLRTGGYRLVDRASGVQRTYSNLDELLAAERQAP